MKAGDRVQFTLNFVKIMPELRRRRGTVLPVRTQGIMYRVQWDSPSIITSEPSYALESVTWGDDVEFHQQRKDNENN